MRILKNLAWGIKIGRDTKGQDFIEYALLAGFIAVVTSAFLPGVATGVSTIFSQVGSVMSTAASGVQELGAL
jgi:Flp pilus assembly pilin Flp